MKHPYRTSPLFTDLYELTMAAGYFARKMFSHATFSLFVRDARSLRNYFVAAGIEDVLDGLADLGFSGEELQYLHHTGLFQDEFLSYLEHFAFNGDVYAMSEGTVFFPDEPVLEITAPIIEAQLVETFLLNSIGFQTLIASKAARCIHVAGKRPLIDFSLRRTQGQDAGLKVARSTYITGFAATSNVLAGKLYSIPVSGTMAHSYVEAFDREIEAFRAYAELFPNNAIFLIDTYDTITGAENAVVVAKEMKARGHLLVGVRLDSGDMADLSKKVRKILDDEGLSDVKIFASSGFDEFKIAKVIEKGANIDAFGVGTNVGTSSDAPYLDVVYKMVRFGDRNVRKLSPGKITLAGEKQVFRIADQKGRYIQDTIALRNENLIKGEPLLKKVMENGKCLKARPELDRIRNSFEMNFSKLDPKYKSIYNREYYPVKFSPMLKSIQ